MGAIGLEAKLLRYQDRDGGCAILSDFLGELEDQLAFLHSKFGDATENPAPPPMDRPARRLMGSRKIMARARSASALTILFRPRDRQALFRAIGGLRGVARVA